MDSTPTFATCGMNWALSCANGAMNGSSGTVLEGSDGLLVTGATCSSLECLAISFAISGMLPLTTDLTRAAMSFLIPGGKLLHCRQSMAAVNFVLTDSEQLLCRFSYLAVSCLRYWQRQSGYHWLMMVAASFIVVDFELGRFLGPFPLYSQACLSGSSFAPSRLGSWLFWHVEM